MELIHFFEVVEGLDAGLKNTEEVLIAEAFLSEFTENALLLD